MNIVERRFTQIIRLSAYTIRVKRGTETRSSQALTADPSIQQNLSVPSAHIFVSAHVLANAC
jgi:hypothetical protein